MSYSVVIPTMGRNTLNRAILSVLEQTVAPNEIIVVAGRPPRLSFEYLSKVHVIENYDTNLSVWTAAHNRNLGIKDSASEFIALLDDDDEWLPNKIERQLRHLDGRETLVSLTSAIVNYEGGFRKLRPNQTMNSEESILSALYGRRTFHASKVYLPTPSVMLSAKLAKSVAYDETLLGFEDTWWLHQLQCAGARVEQLNEALTIVNAEPTRSISRDSFDKNRSWALRLESVQQGFGTNFLKGICLRNALMSHKYLDALKYLRAI